MKRVGIITMHKVLNYGSALQAYALQRKVEDLGCQATIIDYLYPNREHCERQQVKFFPKRSLVHFALIALVGVLLKILQVKSKKKKADAAIRRFRQHSAFRAFYRKYFKLSKEYTTIESLMGSQERYDIYMTGSDQVWNPQYMVDDPNFLLGFAPAGARKYSYAASFAGKAIPEGSVELYRKYLEQYKRISVREQSTSDVVKGLIGSPAEIVCDPSLLLDREEWLKFCPAAPLVKEKYLLVYILHYSFDPYPSIIPFVNKLARERNLQVVVLHGLKEGYSIEGALSFDSVGPVEFLRLFRDASLVVTTSFHGTAFSLNFGRDFYSVVKQINGSDSRVVDLLSVCGARHHLVELNSLESLQGSSVDAMETEKLSEFRNRSIDYLQKILTED